ncbi:DNA polymerase III subunit gamma/tau [Allomeiothermus silvanus]|uniref:DNA polymerase III subunit gamma/tau n=1 Tax=Allomeiothermus silvanus TaxID=52022 RepID=UPI0023F429EB|nr:DNA polymerase III subunit gamma/tau [Allomeiothermus silvanus]
MSALYRQARPTTFDEVVGQEHVKEVLLSAIRTGRLAQAYLFSGPRGVGKTSSARLIAQAVNCTAQADKPCGVCEGCRLVREGNHPDVLEIDAASNNSVEDVRELRERILLAPLLGSRKVVILDEAHMMSKSAFNALLKTLEEPPEHVIFIFATTEPERMPPTILSRTQHFRFRRLSEAEIVQKLSRILKTMDREAEPAALQLVARIADGAMRDAESLLDRLLALEVPITLAQTEAALGLPPQEALWGLAEALEQGQIRQALSDAQNLYTQGFAARTLAQGLLEAFRAGLYAKMGLGTGPRLESSEEKLVAAMTALDESLERLLKRSDALALELAVLTAFQALHAQAPRVAETSSTSTQPVTPNKSSLPDFNPVGRGAPDTGRKPPETLPASSTHPPEPVPSPQMAINLAQAWRNVLGALKINQRAFFREALPHLEGQKLVLVFPEKASFHYQSAQKSLEAIQTAVREVMGDLEVSLVLQGEKKKVESRSVISLREGGVNGSTPQRGEDRISTAIVGDPSSGIQPNPPQTAPLSPRERESVQPTPPSSPPEPEATAGDDPPWPDDETSPEVAEAPPSAAQNLVEDPRFQKLLRTFGGRIRKLVQDTPKAPDAEGATQSDEGSDE